MALLESLYEVFHILLTLDSCVPMKSMSKVTHSKHLQHTTYNYNIIKSLHHYKVEILPLQMAIIIIIGIL